MPQQIRSHTVHRRRFLQQSAAALAAGYFIAESKAQESSSPNERLDIAAVGVANKGGHNLEQLASQNIVALCDVDENFLRQAALRFPQARQYRDYRKMLEAEANRVQAVVVSTADHTHAPAASVALDLGLHVYCEKPLTHTVAEARALARLAAKNKLATQMGTQIHASDNYRRVVELVQSGAIGTVNEVYTWCGKGWSNGRFQPTGDPPPAHLAWDLWLGPAQERPYSPHVHPGDWRRFWEYGAGTLGDMGCHVMDLPFWALALRHPTTIAAEGPEVDPVGTPEWTRVTYTYPRLGGGELKLYWADGTATFDLLRETKDHAGMPLSSWGLGILFVGDKGMLAADYGRRQLLPQSQFEGFTPPEPTIPDSVGHWQEWVNACKDGTPTTCNFDYSGALTEAVLLGTVAYRSGEEIVWDAEQLRAKNSQNADQYLTKRYRQGFEVVGLQS